MNVETQQKLRAPFDASKVGKLPRMTCPTCAAKDKDCPEHKRKRCGTCKSYLGQHTHLDYVGHAHVTERLLDVDPEWAWEPMAFAPSGLPSMDENNGLWIRLTVGGKTMLGYGDAPGKRGGNAVKEAIGDAIRNASMRFGVALDLWKKESPEPAAQEQQPPVKPQTEEDRRAELRGQIALIGRQSGKQIQEMADEFAAWSQGQDIARASVAVLAEYKDHLQREVPDE